MPRLLLRFLEVAGRVSLTASTLALAAAGSRARPGQCTRSHSAPAQVGPQDVERPLRYHRSRRGRQSGRCEGERSGFRLSDVSDAAKGLPPQMQGMPASVLYPMLLDQLVDRQALVDEARKAGLDKDPAVQKQMAAASDRALQTALISERGRPESDRGGGPRPLRSGNRRQARRGGSARAAYPGPDRGRSEGHHRPTQEGRRLRRAREAAQQGSRRGSGRAISGFFKKRTWCLPSPTRPSPFKPGQFTQTP